jgi:hypothetical protein
MTSLSLRDVVDKNATKTIFDASGRINEINVRPYSFAQVEILRMTKRMTPLCYRFHWSEVDRACRPARSAIILNQASDPTKAEIIRWNV